MRLILHSLLVGLLLLTASISAWGAPPVRPEQDVVTSAPNSAIAFRAPSQVHMGLIGQPEIYERPGAGARGKGPKDKKRRENPYADLPEHLRKNPARGFLYSMILPGMGQRYVDRPVRGAMYTTIEVGLWTGILLAWQGHVSQTDAYERFAQEHANVTGEHSVDYYADIGNYNTIELYNAAKRQRRDYDAQYDTDTEYWSWDSSGNRVLFDKTRISAGQHRNRIYYLIGGMIINRLVSAIDAARSLSNAQKDYREANGLMVGWSPEVNGPAVQWTGNVF